MSAIWHFTLKENVRGRKRESGRRQSPQNVNTKYLSLKNKLATFITEGTWESTLHPAVRAEEVSEALPSDFDSPWKAG